MGQLRPQQAFSITTLQQSHCFAKVLLPFILSLDLVYLTILDVPFSCGLCSLTSKRTLTKNDLFLSHLSISGLLIIVHGWDAHSANILSSSAERLKECKFHQLPTCHQAMTANPEGCQDSPDFHNLKQNHDVNTPFQFPLHILTHHLRAKIR